MYDGECHGLLNTEESLVKKKAFKIYPKDLREVADLTSSGSSFQIRPKAKLFKQKYQACSIFIQAWTCLADWSLVIGVTKPIKAWPQTDPKSALSLSWDKMEKLYS